MIEAIVNVMSWRGLWGKVGPKGENVASPRYSTEVLKTVQEPGNIALVWEWYRLAIGKDTSRAQLGRIDAADARTKPLLAHIAKGKLAKKGGALAGEYAKGLEEIGRAHAREQVGDLITLGDNREKTFRSFQLGSDDQALQAGVDQASKVLTDAVAAARRVVSPMTNAKIAADAAKRLYAREVKAYNSRVGMDRVIPWEGRPHRAEGLNAAEGITLMKGALDAVSAVLTVTDPKARAELVRARSNYFGTVAVGAELNKLMWQFVSGSIALGGATLYATLKLAGKAQIAEQLLDTATAGVSNVGAALNLAGLVHGLFVMLDPDASAEAKAEAVLEMTTGAIGLGGFAAKWVPQLAGFARWSGPISASLTINFYMFRHLGKLGHRARVGLTRLDWGTCHRNLKAAGVEVQSLQRRLAVTLALHAAEKDPRRKRELRLFADAFRYALVEQQLKPFLQARAASTSMDDDSAFCGPALNRRLVPLLSLLGDAAGTDDAALAAGASFLLAVEKAFVDWDQIVMEKAG